jgi:hypothetical protein
MGYGRRYDAIAYRKRCARGAPNAQHRPAKVGLAVEKEPAAHLACAAG